MSFTYGHLLSYFLEEMQCCRECFDIIMMNNHFKEPLLIDLLCHPIFHTCVQITMRF